MKINCYFSTKKHLAYRKTFKASAVKHSRAFKGYYCSNYYTKKQKTKKQTIMKNISKVALEYLVFHTILTLRML